MLNIDSDQISIAIDVNYPNGLRWFRLSESSFTMEPGASKDIQLNIDEKMFEDKVNLNKRFKENLKKRYNYLHMIVFQNILTRNIRIKL